MRIAAVSESSAAAAATEVEIAEPIAPSETVVVEPAPSTDVFESVEPAAEPEPVDAEPAPLSPRSAEWTRPTDSAWTAAAAERVLHRHPPAELPTPVAAPPAAALPAVASVPQAKVLSPLPGCNPAPEYPSLARRRGIEGVVEIRVCVDAGGSVIECAVAVSSGSRLLDAAAMKAVARWRFEHGPGEAQIPFRFDLAH